MSKPGPVIRVMKRSPEKSPVLLNSRYRQVRLFSFAHCGEDLPSTISLHLCFCKENMLVNSWIILPKFKLLCDPTRILALHIEKPGSGC
uniref:Uncharacterized protein n=1 Tax=Oryza meridionalis TaxID=40149 RepID=A0A0E0DSA9_9ORYZ